METVLIVGCGDIGRRVARRYLAAGTAVTGIVRSESSGNRLEALGATAIVWDLDEPAQPVSLPDNKAGLFYFAPPPAQGDTDTRLTHFLQVADPARFATRLVYISTSGVYGDCRGEWINEERAANPQTGRARRRYAAETALAKWSRSCGVPVIILRVPGIYAADRLPESRLRSGLPVLREQDSPYTNRIHAEDLADVCIAAAERGTPGAVYNVSDGHPTTMCDYFNRVADFLDLPRPTQLNREEAERALSDAMLSYLNESRRIDNTRMRTELGVELQYPDLDSALRS